MMSVPSPLLDQVPDVEIDPEGRFKYVLIRVYAPATKDGNEPSKMVVRGNARGAYHGEPRFKVGARVHVKFFTGSPWEPGTVKKVRGSMMYQLETPRGVVQRHQNQLRTDKALRGILRHTASDPSSSSDGQPEERPSPKHPVRAVRFQPEVLRQSDRAHRAPSRYPS